MRELLFTSLPAQAGWDTGPAVASSRVCDCGISRGSPPWPHMHGAWVGGSWLSLTEDLYEVAAVGFPLVLASSKLGSTRVCAELQAQGSVPFVQRLTWKLFVLRLNTGRMVLFLLGF